MSDIERDFVHLARLAVESRQEDAAALIRRTFRGLMRQRPDLVPAAQEILEQMASASPVRGGVLAHPLPVDADSRLELLTREYPVTVPTPPVWSEQIADQLASIIEERHKATELMRAGIEPTRSALLIGPPGVGKTLAARWLAAKLGRPFLTLDLAAVMSSFLGRTGNNIRAVLGYARGAQSVLLLDEFDAIAKRRDDATDVGELKRLVTVLLQAVDDWPSDGLLLAATNHPELLDLAVWRRFDRLIEFPLPGVADIAAFVRQELGDSRPSAEVFDLLIDSFKGASFAEIARELNDAKRHGVIRGIDLRKRLEERAYELLRSSKTPRTNRVEIALGLVKDGLSQREIQRRTGVSRDTLRKRLGPTQRRIERDG
jgi:SpoVK/Ycf46/Vps4 family AAA+-type ATPase